MGSPRTGAANSGYRFPRFGGEFLYVGVMYLSDPVRPMMIGVPGCWWLRVPPVTDVVESVSPKKRLNRQRHAEAVRVFGPVGLIAGQLATARGASAAGLRGLHGLRRGLRGWSISLMIASAP